MARKHTPGPWNAAPMQDYYGAYQILKVRDKHVRKYSAAEDKANAALISAAPDLLAALDYLLGQTVDMDLKHGIELTEGEQEARTIALAAIAKAGGEKS